MIYFLFVGDSKTAAPSGIIRDDEAFAKTAAGAVAAGTGLPVTILGAEVGYLALIEPATPAEHLARYHSDPDCGARPECAVECHSAARGAGVCMAPARVRPKPDPQAFGGLTI